MKDSAHSIYILSSQSIKELYKQKAKFNQWWIVFISLFQERYIKSNQFNNVKSKIEFMNGNLAYLR